MDAQYQYLPQDVHTHVLNIVYILCSKEERLIKDHRKYNIRDGI